MVGSDEISALDPSIICGAGVITRIARRLVLSWDNYEWQAAPGGKEIDIGYELSHHYQRGLALSGRRIFVGNENHVLAFDIVPAQVQ